MTRSEGLHIKIPKEFIPELKTQGVSWSVFAEREFSLDQSVDNIKYTAERMQPKIIKRSEQIDDFLQVMSAPFCKPYIYIISGKPNDTRASCVAAALLIQASLAQEKLKENPDHPNARYGKLERPTWIKLTNDFRDNVSPTVKKPSFLVLSNITPNSSNIKLEKIRDILETYDRIPRVLVVNEFDPITFANHKIFHKPDYVMYLTQGLKKVEM